jgi:UDP-4-amino-4,6-dideoxy-N-acetyl-beta-L-altrosamine transaminase
MKIPYGKQFIDKDDIKAVSKALQKDFITQGPIIEQFERKVCRIVGSKYAVALSSCSAGLHLALASIKKTKKKEVITSPISFVSTANAIIHNKYNPVFLDIDKYSLNLCINKFENYISRNKNISAVIPVHLGGYAFNSKILFNLAKRKKIYVIEDAAHSFGAKYEDGNMVGSCKYSDITVFSFHPVKTLTTGEGGVVTTNSRKIYERLLRLRSHGIEKKTNQWKNKKFGFTNGKKNPWYYEMQNLGFNYRITDIQCALGLSQLKKLKKIINKRIKIANIYDENFKDLENVFLPQFKNRNISSNHLYVLNLDFKRIKINRRDFMRILIKKGIITQVHYIPIHLHPYFKNKPIKKLNLENAMRYYNQALSIPIFYDLSSSDQKKIINIIKKTLRR